MLPDREVARAVIALELDADDLAATRFTISPLHEVVISLFPIYICPVLSQTNWAVDTRRRLSVDRELLTSLVSPDRTMPDFIVPAPKTSRPTFGEQLDQIRETPPEQVVADMRDTFANAPLPRIFKRLEDDPAAVRDAIATTLAQYWSVAIAPHWQRMNAMLEADVLYRGVQCTQVGTGAVLNQIDRQIRWEDGALIVDSIGSGNERVSAAGRVTQLFPSVFVKSQSPTVQISPEQPPWLGYRARRSPLLWDDVTPVASSAIRELLGPRRARLLVALDQPRSTTQLAHQTMVTPSAISQQLRVLAAAGLVDRARVGRVVLYCQTELGRLLLSGSGYASDHDATEPFDLLGDLTA
jgi:DNA-binding transcriptional ArsR family regulator